MAEVLAQEGQTIFDICISTGFPIDDIFGLILQNSAITSIDFPLEITPNYFVQFDPASIPKNSADVIVKTPKSISEIGYILSQDGQSIYDLCLMSGYGIDQIMDFIQYNSIDSINEGAFDGKVFSYNTKQIVDSIYYNYLVNNKIVIGTMHDTEIIGAFLIDELGEYIVTEYHERLYV